jgi:hypothetical protein
MMRNTRAGDVDAEEGFKDHAVVCADPGASGAPRPWPKGQAAGIKQEGIRTGSFPPGLSL